MTYGSDGAEYPDYGSPAPHPQHPGPYQAQDAAGYPGPGGDRVERRAFEQDPYYGDATRRAQPRGFSRPEPYDPFQTRAHDEAAQRRREDPYQEPGQGRRRQGGGQEQRGYGGYDAGRPDGPARARGERGYGDGGYDEGGRYPDGGERGYGASPPRERDGRTYGSARPRTGDRLGATSLLDEDGLPANGAVAGAARRGQAGPGAGRPGAAGPEDPDDSGQSGGRSNRRRGKKVVPPHVRRRRKIVWRSVLGVFLVFFGYVGITLYPYLAAPGTDRLAARVAEWGRDHYLGWAVTWLENASYKPPPTGGGLDSGQLAQLQGAPAPSPTVKAADLPANITPLAAGTVAGEGIWHPVTMDAQGVPIVEKAALRPDAQHTSNLAYVVWMNQKELRFTLHPGYQQPGGTWQTADSISQSDRAGLVATWNGGFKVRPDDALAGFYMDGRTAVPLVTGKAAEVFYTDGSIKIGQWGRDETMGPKIKAVRQNLSLLVDNGQVTVGPGDGSSSQWGYTIKNSYFIARSGVGMTAKGDIVYVSGRFLSVYTLAKLLQAAGAVDGMELDINPDWVSFMTYAGPDPANPTPTKLWDFVQPAGRYFQPSDRDFVAVHKR
ncbi:phosphodiester glycosidase family protein [Actinocrinis puniceicyclus]|uniref:Phosphodiester glycosidase family protein n=1 Tax=Actinocrinis puniceicyclus TaxID=977794 RepID=A0A8J8BD85_9ACTN|nr:phosphodiester glycosidase family protein [Actinocrinis puniceicyclus]MBS2964988.1 phosphodiester glycosidase family protein [Actinocrinis puniceicyclus]